MMKMIFATALLFAGVSASAYTINDMAAELSTSVLAEMQPLSGPNFKVGDTASYKLSGGFINGKMVMSVKAVSNTEVQLGQDMDMGFMGKQSCVMTVDLTNGKTKSMVCNGQAQDTSSQEGSEIEDITEDNITVPAGTFDCMHVVIKTKDGQKVDQWVNPKLVPVAGLIKSIVPSQMGTMTLVLTSFKKN